MLRIEVILFGVIGTPHFMSHIGAVICDEDADRKFAIEYGQINPRMLYSVETDYYVSKEILYAEGDLVKFKKAYEKKFPPSNNEYRFLTHNCADAVKFILNYFFKLRKINASMTFFKTVVGVPTAGSLGLLSFMPLPVGINSPKEVFFEARLLALSHQQKKLKKAYNHEKQAVLAPKESDTTPPETSLTKDFSFETATY